MASINTTTCVVYDVVRGTNLENLPSLNERDKRTNRHFKTNVSHRSDTCMHDVSSTISICTFYSFRLLKIIFTILFCTFISHYSFPQHTLILLKLINFWTLSFFFFLKIQLNSKWSLTCVHWLKSTTKCSIDNCLSTEQQLFLDPRACAKRRLRDWNWTKISQCTRSLCLRTVKETSNVLTRGNFFEFRIERKSRKSEFPRADRRSWSLDRG